ncbi:hypothetical protein C8R44DRAFT_890759 [Mycena epipterygia]|nr:hypothetical protein C8R44DRAFT_890759 [Mycena epipterygia]
MFLRGLTLWAMQRAFYQEAADANDESDVVAGADENAASEKWNVTFLNNKRYTIKNHGCSNFAACDTRPNANDSVSGRSRNKQWVVKETRTRRQFTISHSDATDLVWGLADGEISTPVGFLIGAPFPSFKCCNGS